MDEKRIQKTILKKTCADEVNNYDNAVSKLPVGLKILIVDDDRTCLLVLETMLLKLSYEVTKCQLARDALALLGENKNRFDIVICDLHLPDMDGFKLLEIIRLEMDLPVVMMSSDDGKGVVIKGILNGACDYLVKPVRMEAIRFIWQHVVRKRKLSQSGNNVNQESLSIFARDKKCVQSLKRQKEGEEDDDDVESSDEVAASNKKPRMIWTQELHDVFVAAINQLGHDKAVPKKILERMQAMNVTGITRANIASHLQKYRMHLQKVGETSTESRDLNAFLEQSSFQLQHNLQVKVTQPAAALFNQLRLQNSVAPQQSYRFERANENYLSALTSQNHQGSHVFNSPMHNPNLIYQNDYPGDFVISNEEYFCTSVTNVTEHSNNQDDLLFHGGPFV